VLLRGPARWWPFVRELLANVTIRGHGYKIRERDVHDLVHRLAGRISRQGRMAARGVDHHGRGARSVAPG
jgi:hypothetical protein